MCSGAYLRGTRKDENGVGVGTGAPLPCSLTLLPAGGGAGQRQRWGAAGSCAVLLAPGARRCVLQDVNECSGKVALQYLCSLSLATV